MLVLDFVFVFCPPFDGWGARARMGWDGALLSLDDNVCLTDWTLIVSEEGRKEGRKKERKPTLPGMTTSPFSSPFSHRAILCFALILVSSYIRGPSQYRSRSRWVRNLPYSMVLRSAVLIYSKTITASHLLPLRNERDAQLSVHPFHFTTCAQTDASRN